MAATTRSATRDEADVRARLCALGDHIRSTVVDGRGDVDMATVAGATHADTIYGIDRLADDALVAWFEEHWTDVRLISEGHDEPVVLGEPAWTVIVDSIDGTRGLMYDKRSAWVLAAAAPVGGSLADVRAASMTELPPTKQRLADQYSAAGSGPLVGTRTDLVTSDRAEIRARPSSAIDLEHGFAGVSTFFPPGKARLVEIEAELFGRLGVETVFDDEYISSGGQIHELMTGRDRFVADLRPLVDPAALACHPYDLCTAMLLAKAGGVVTDPWGAPLDAPLDTTTPVAWVGYANPRLAETIGPVLADVLRDLVG